jgi:predicted DNA-binding antitoxin AbrB/MazE fold protein
MAITVEAVYENGVLKPEKPLPLAERQRVDLTVHIKAGSPPPGTEADEDVVRRSYGLLGWTGDVETLRRIAMDPEFGPEESR